MLRAVGARHSPNACAMVRGGCDDGLVDLSRLDRLLSVAAQPASRGGGALVTVEAGMTLAALNAHLDARGLALPVLGSISAQTVAGALATGTHGSAGACGEARAARRGHGAGRARAGRICCARERTRTPPLNRLRLAPAPRPQRRTARCTRCSKA